MASDISALISALSYWEAAGYAALAAVLIGVIGESIHQFVPWPSSGWWRANGGKASALILIAGLASEGITQVETNSTSGQIIADLNLQEATLSQRNLAFERAISPRTLEQNLTGQHLRRFADVEVVVESLPDAEPRRAAGQIRFMLIGEAGWKRFSGTLPPFPFSDGVIVHTAPSIVARDDALAKLHGEPRKPQTH
jgi:hypothetical protein